MKYNFLTPIKYIGRSTNKSKTALWLFECQCGTKKIYPLSTVKRGLLKSCGCYQRTVRTNMTHGDRGTITYSSWSSMRSRCRNKNLAAYKNYGGRGIKVCKRWQKYENFKADLGVRPSKDHWIERIDVNKGYNKKNCCWKHRKHAVNNRRVTAFYTYKRQTKSLSEWCTDFERDYCLVWERLRAGWSFERALTEPKHLNKVRY